MIRPVANKDVGQIAHIYNHYIEKTVITFEESPLTVTDMASRIEGITNSGFPWFVVEKEGYIVGYAYATRWNGRSAYRYTAEVTVYLSERFKSEGWGTKLYSALFDALRDQKIHIVIGGITLPNPASVALHEKFGMKQIAHFKEVGFKFGQWLDVGYWQVVLDE